MALIECPECKNNVSEKASACPKCGHSLMSTQNRVSLPSGGLIKRFVLGTGEVLISLIVILGCIGSIYLGYQMAEMSRPVKGLNYMGERVYEEATGKYFFTFFIVSSSGILGVILGSFLIFLLIDIRDELRKLNVRQNQNQSSNP
jgi:prepilin signal peptidase PulO-like enzyme (type II secretory pathway)